MPTPIAERIAVSTWSLHRLLGTTYPHDLSTEAGQEWQRGFNDGTSLANIDLSASLDGVSDPDFPDVEAA